MTATRPLIAPPSGRKARQTFDLLLRSARQVLTDSGTITADSVAQRAGVATATFYVYFSSRDDCLAAAFDEVLRENNERLARALSIERLLDDGLDATLRHVVVEVVEAFRDNAIVFRAALARLPESKTIRDVYRRDEREGLEVVQRFLELAMAAGQVREGNLEVMASVLLVTLEGLNNRALFARSGHEAVIDELVVMMRALLAHR